MWTRRGTHPLYRPAPASTIRGCSKKSGGLSLGQRSWAMCALRWRLCYSKFDAILDLDRRSRPLPVRLFEPVPRRSGRRYRHRRRRRRTGRCRSRCHRRWRRRRRGTREVHLPIGLLDRSDLRRRPMHRGSGMCWPRRLAAMRVGGDPVRCRVRAAGVLPRPVLRDRLHRGHRMSRRLHMHRLRKLRGVFRGPRRPGAGRRRSPGTAGRRLQRAHELPDRDLDGGLRKSQRARRGPLHRSDVGQRRTVPRPVRPRPRARQRRADTPDRTTPDHLRLRLAARSGRPPAAGHHR